MAFCSTSRIETPAWLTCSSTSKIVFTMIGARLRDCSPPLSRSKVISGAGRVAFLADLKRVKSHVDSTGWLNNVSSDGGRGLVLGLLGLRAARLPAEHVPDRFDFLVALVVEAVGHGRIEGD